MTLSSAEWGRTTPLLYVRRDGFSRAVAAIWMCFVLLAGTGCSRIGVSPSCPPELAPGASGPIAANEQNPGAIPTFQWEVLPAGVGRIVAPDQPNTTFEASQEGEAIIRLTASDGLFQVIAECRTLVTSTPSSVPPAAPPSPPAAPPSGSPPASMPVAVSLVVTPAPLAVGQEATLTCTSAGEVEAVAFTVGQVDGRPVTLTAVSPGVATFTPDADGPLTFRCIGQTADGRQSLPVDQTITVMVANGGGGRGGTRPGRR